MGGYGRQNPYPFQYGGGETITEQTWMALRKSIGGHRDQHGPGPIGGLEDTWRFAKVAGLVKVLAMSERAAIQALPNRVTDHLEVYERALLVPEQPTDEERRQAITFKWTRELNALIPEIREKLQEIDPVLDVYTYQWEDAITTVAGRSLASMAHPAQYGRYGTSWPGYASNYDLHVVWPGMPLQFTAKHQQIHDYLNDALPSWIGFQIVNKCGFALDGCDESRLDCTGLDP